MKPRITIPKLFRKNKLKQELIILCISIGFLTLGSIALWGANLQLPEVSSFNTRILSQSTKFYDKTGEIELFDTHQNIRRSEVPYDAISDYVKMGTVAIEDDTFYEHHGIRPLAILRSLFVDAASLDFSQGGSTITQQVVKNSLLTKDKSIARKLKEWILAIKLEKVMSKDDILSVYLNEAPYGGNIYGVEEASRAYFHVGANDLTLAQAAYLSALPQAPTYYSPYGNHKDALEKRKNMVLDKMLSSGKISQDQYETAKNEKVTFHPPIKAGTLAPHFVFFLRDYLQSKYGESVVDSGGLKVITTIDADLQKKAEDIVKARALSNKTNFDAENASLVAIDPKTGQILAMVGSREYFDTDIDGNFNIALAHRQPGSTFKPFVYATAFEKGYTPETVLFDVPTEFSTTCDDQGKPLSASAKCYSPQNYDEKFRGPISLRNSLAQSLNVPSVKTLYLAGINDSLSTARSLGISTLQNADQYGLTLVLGGGEVSLLEITSAYGVFANDGVRNPYTGIISVTNSDGGVLEQYEANANQVIPSDVARTISDILSDNVARTPAYGPNSALYFPGRQVAVKTGTTNDSRDAWTIGYTPSIVVGTWAGNNDNHPMVKKVAGQIVAPMWNEFMSYALQKIPNERFPQATPIDESKLPPVMRGIWQGNDITVLDARTNTPANDNTPLSSRIEQVVVNIHSILYFINKNNPLLPTLGISTTDPQFSHWEYAVRKWAQQQGFIDGTKIIIPLESGVVDQSSTIINQFTEPTTLTISPPIDTDIHQLGNAISFTITAPTAFNLQSVDIYLNNTLIGKLSNKPFYFSLNPREYLSTIKKNTALKIVGRNSENEVIETTTTLHMQLD